ncbi:MAG: DUF2254 domain-containing protein [Proteobacteria bacterium]|nr:DUF2254 domain-containing protein [Burkholderiales bacterium]
MKKLRRLWDQLRSSLWLVPALIVIGAVVLAAVMVDAGALLDMDYLLERWPRLFGVGAAGSRGLLTSIAGSMITVAGVTFSITIVALTLASSQYSSRILQNFMRDRANQIVLGVFLGVFAYCLVVLRTIRGGDEVVFVPAIAVLTALLLAFVAIGFLIFFIHHVAVSIQATSIIESAARETLEAVDRLFPADVGNPVSEDSPQAEHAYPGTWTMVPSLKTGYIQAVDADALFELARERDIVVKMERAIGEFVIEGASIASVTGGKRDEALVRTLNKAYATGRQRTLTQDAAYGIRQIVDVALKALSPGINDTTTAIHCLDFLGAILARLATRAIEPPRRSDGSRLRLVTRGPTFQRLLGESFDQIRQNADGNVATLSRLVQILEILAMQTEDPHRRSAIRQQAALVIEVVDRSVPAAYDRASVQATYARLVSLLDAKG